MRIAAILLAAAALVTGCGGGAASSQSPAEVKASMSTTVYCTQLGLDQYSDAFARCYHANYDATLEDVKP